MTATAVEQRFAQASWRALGTYVQLTVERAAALPQAQARAQHLLDAVDLACSRFRDDSDLARANASAGQWVEVDPLLVAALRVALRAAGDTDGLVDPCLGKALPHLGYDTDIEAVRGRDLPAGPADIPAPVTPQAWRAVEIEDDAPGACRVRVPLGAALDLGATGKAFAADLVAADLAAAGTCCIVSAGGDVAIGVPEGHEGVEWPVQVSERPGAEPDQTVWLASGGLATSSVLHRSWSKGGAPVHHLLDPRTGRPAPVVWRTVTVAAGTCAEANTASTVSVVLGHGALQWLQDRDLPARLVDADGRVVLTGGWPS